MSKRNAPEVQTFGCRLNIWESEVMRNQAGAAGLSDAIIFNTCAVTAEAENRRAKPFVKPAAITLMPKSLSRDALPRLHLKHGRQCLR